MGKQTKEYEYVLCKVGADSFYWGYLHEIVIDYSILMYLNDSRE